MTLVRTTASGFGLIEALVALIVLSVGMIGIASLYAHGLGAQRTALYRTIAVSLAAEMADRIRANRVARAAYGAAAAPTGCGPGGSACSLAELAAYDKFVWEQLVAQQLPRGAGTVAYAPGTPPTYTIAVSWQDVAGGAEYRISAQIPPL